MDKTFDQSIQILKEALKANILDLEQSGIEHLERVKYIHTPSDIGGVEKETMSFQEKDSVTSKVSIEKKPEINENPSLDETTMTEQSRLRVLETSSLNQEEKLDEMRQRHIGNCQRCKLSRGRSQIIFGAGDPNADLMFIGEAPSMEDDKKGIPFVGASGQLLDRMIKAMGFDRQQVYLSSVVKCRPPKNRNPEKDELSACLPFLESQIKIIKPKVIVTLGKYASQTLLGLQTPITKLRGNWHEKDGIKVMPTFHPAYLLRVPENKRAVWDDLQKVMEVF